MAKTSLKDAISTSLGHTRTRTAPMKKLPAVPAKPKALPSVSDAELYRQQNYDPALKRNNPDGKARR